MYLIGGQVMVLHILSRYAFDLKGSKIDEKLQHISQFTQSTIIELRDTIWAMNQAEISFEDLRTRIYNFIEKARLARQDISFSFEIDATLRELKVTSVQGMNIYRSIQEAVNNAIKHSRASHVEVAIKREDDDVEIVITDNGVGFDQATIHDGNGLGNIKKRITDIGGAVTVQSSPAGVRLQISIGGLMQRLKNQSL
ncbi:MAG: hypothetical protein EOO01_24820 [Chitinophagaceae bacterium]|nr:MAG: hypothetical protein EOO01_24820 [Chitinophagaceae bacterium]